MITLLVEGMQCGHCVKRVTQVIHGLDPHAFVFVDLANNTINIVSVNDADQFANVVRELGYQVVGSAGAKTSYEPVEVARGCCCA